MPKLSLFSDFRRINFLFQSTVGQVRAISTRISPITSTEDEGGGLKRQIMRLKSPQRSATAVLQNRISEGQRISVSELRHIAKKLVKSKRYDHALEILKWMEIKNNSSMTSSDHAIRLELTIKIHGLVEAEEYFTQLPNTASRKATYLPLLSGYVKERNTMRAEAFMVKLMNLGLILDPHSYNEMMKLYVSTSQNEKVLLVIRQMKQNRVPRNVLSYNLWMNACEELYGVDSVEMVYRKMLSDMNVQVGWSTLSTLANVYIKSGLIEKAIWILNLAEKKLSGTNRLGYFFLMTLYANLKNKDGVLRVWNSSKSAVEGRTTCANYMCVLLCLVKVSGLEEAERVFEQWELNSRKYDVRVSNVLLGAYVRNGLMEKAEKLHLRTLERGGSPNYKTWEILMEGWEKSHDMEIANDAVEKSLVMLEQLVGNGY